MIVGYILIASSLPLAFFTFVIAFVLPVIGHNHINNSLHIDVHTTLYGLMSERLLF